MTFSQQFEKGRKLNFFFMFFNNVDESGVIWSCPPSIEKFLSPFYHHSAGCWSLNDPLEIQKIGLMSVQRSLYYIMGRLAGVIITPEDGNMLIKGEKEGFAHQVPLSGRPCVLHCMMLRHQSDKWPHYTHMHHQEGLSLTLFWMRKGSVKHYQHQQEEKNMQQLWAPFFSIERIIYEEEGGYIIGGPFNREQLGEYCIISQ